MALWDRDGDAHERSILPTGEDDEWYDAPRTQIWNTKQRRTDKLQGCDGASCRIGVAFGFFETPPRVGHVGLSGDGTPKLVLRGWTDCCQSLSARGARRWVMSVTDGALRLVERARFL